MESITTEDLILINNLSTRRYTDYTHSSNTTQIERDRFNLVKKKLLKISEHFARKYNALYGPFTTSVSPEGNPLNRQNNFHNVWSTFFKGATNKQYAAQISFVIDREKPCLNVGFYFGRASAISLSADQRIVLETNLEHLGITLSEIISNNTEFQINYNSLFDFGFIAYSNGEDKLPNEWQNEIKTNARNSQITAKIYPNDFGVIENSTIDLFVSQIIFMMGAIRDLNQQEIPINIAPLTPEQRAKEAERLAQIGLNGELFVLKMEAEKLEKRNIIGYPDHVALKSNNYGYDILSLDENGEEIFIEVKTTTRKKDDPYSKKFFVSNHEIKTFEANKSRYKIYRVYDIENNPIIKELNLDSLKKHPDGYIVTY